MSYSNSIRLTLNIKDRNITFEENHIKIEIIDEIETQLYLGDLIPPASNIRPILRLRKQRYLANVGSKHFELKRT